MSARKKNFRYVVVDRHGVESVAGIRRTNKSEHIAHAKSCNAIYPEDAPHIVMRVESWAVWSNWYGATIPPHRLTPEPR